MMLLALRLNQDNVNSHMSALGLRTVSLVSGNGTATGSGNGGSGAVISSCKNPAGSAAYIAAPDPRASCGLAALCCVAWVTVIARFTA